jgi:hypothetical protein
MYLEIFYPTVLLALGEPEGQMLRKIPRVHVAFSNDATSEYFEQFVVLAKNADVLGFKNQRYPLSREERLPLYNKVFNDFLWWWSDRARG